MFEYCGSVICVFLMEGCMMICNMLIEVGVCVGMVVLDEMMFVYFEGCLYVLKG